ncbi:MAG: hypothetical protein ISS82_03065 [Nanoarchaeota archaeon]|nr:hypothetical protein [Nanoarchaeota archaeon]
MIGQKEGITPAKGLLIRYKGEFNLDEMYKKCKDWFKSKKYIFTEKEHTQKDKPQGTELNIKFVAEREIDDYVRFDIETYFFILEISKKGNVANANVKINIEGWVVLDYKNKWQGNPFSKFLFFIYNNYILKKKIIEVYENKLYLEILNYSKLIKSYLGLP